MAHTNTAGAISRITRELASTQKREDLSIHVQYRDQDVRSVRALIIGPPETPYEFGFFEFDMKFPRDYPIASPQVRAITTNSNRTRFNPNIYADGKVCLSILGTWRGAPGEQWSSVQGLESVLLSIQSLMSANPYENEPSFEKAKKEEAEPTAYIQKVRHETFRISIIQRLEGLLRIQPEKPEPTTKRQRTNAMATEEAELHKSPSSTGASTPATETSTHGDDDGLTYVHGAPVNALAVNAALMESGRTLWDPFADLIKRRFLWYYDTYMRNMDASSIEQKDGTLFMRTQFEHPPNSMEGSFDYKGLRARMEHIRSKLDSEMHSWAAIGAMQVLNQAQLATQLAFQFKQMQCTWNDGQYKGSRMEINLLDPDNPFVWRLTLFGEPMTNLDGGIFTMTMRIPPNFPTAQPRVYVETPIFHHRVSSSGFLCYFPEKEDEIDSHLKAVVKAIEDKQSKFDPRAMINPEIFVLRWGDDNQRKTYNRKLRRSAQESSEFS